MKYKSCDILEKSSNNSYDLVASDETKDRDGEVILADGWELTEFRKNPIMLWGHNSFETPLGSFSKIRVEEKALRMRASFADTEKGKEAKALVDGGHLKTFSVGFGDIIRDEKKSEIITKATLYEVSLVNIPSNPNATFEKSAKLFEKSLSEKFLTAVAKYGTEEILKRIKHFEDTKPTLKMYRLWLKTFAKNKKLRGSEIEQINKVFAKML